MAVTDVVKRKTKRQAAPSRDQLVTIRAALGRWTTLRVDTGRLDADEQRALIHLCGLASTSEEGARGGFNPDRLSKRDRAKLEQIVERSADRPGAFEAARQSAKVREEAEKIMRSALAFPVSRKAEQGFLAEVFRQCAAGCLHVEHVATLTLVVAVLHAGEPLPRSGPTFVEKIPGHGRGRAAV